MQKIKPKVNDKEYIFNVKILMGNYIYWQGRRGDYKEKVLNSKKFPSRKIAMLDRQSLHKFAEAIISSFNFDFDHCFGFFDNIKNVYLQDSTKKYELFADLEDKGIEPVDSESVKKTKVKKAFEKVGEKMIFMFDYGDDWRFLVELLEIKSVNKNKKYPVILERHGQPPEQYPPIDDF